MTLPEISFHLAALTLHIGAGALGLVSGFTALAVRKGGRVHRAAGKVFFLSMLAMASFAGVLAVGKAQWGNLVVASVTGYLVATAWAVVRRRPGASGGFEVAAMLFAAGVAVASFALAAVGAPPFGPDGPSGSGGAAALYYVVGGVAALAALMDLGVLRRGGLEGPARTSRHLWRMCLALFVAAGSFFLGQADEIPQALRGPHLYVPPLLALLAIPFWLIRVRLGRRRKPLPAAA